VTKWLLAVPPAMAAAVAAWGLVAPPAGARPATNELGEQLYLEQCAACHAVDGSGVDERGPSLEHEGAASADFVLRTGRMPLPDPDLRPRRKPVALDEDEIQALVRHVAELGDGPDIPLVQPDRGSVSAGSELFQIECAACHVASGAGAVIGGGGAAPSLMDATSTQVGEAIVVGPGAMPVFGELGPDEIDDVAAYVRHLQDEGTTDIDSLGGVGPVAEGLAAWLIGLIPLIALTRWIGRPDEARDDPAVPPHDADEAAP
jgi:quinol---cytochrome-c reductase cytochrome c subunit